MVRGRALSSAGLILALFAYQAFDPGNAVGQNESSEVFTVDNVAVDSVAQTAAAAREVALAEGQALAFERLMRRLIPREAHSRVPELDEAQRSHIIRDFEVMEEKTSTVRYLASLTVRFKSHEVRELLRRRNIPFAETISKPVLVLPVYRFGGALSLWDEPNPWREAWMDQPHRDGLVPMLVPLGDLADIAEIGAEQAAAGDEHRLSIIAQRYGAGDTLVAIATRGIDLSQNRPTLQVAISRYGTPQQEQTTVQQYVADSPEGIDALLVSAVDAVASDVEEQWKRDNLMTFDQEFQLSVVVPIQNLEDWLEVRRRLAQVPFIRRSELMELSRTEARVDLHYFGHEAKLSLALTQSDLILTQEPGAWVLHLAEVSNGTGNDNRVEAE